MLLKYFDLQSEAINLILIKANQWVMHKHFWDTEMFYVLAVLRILGK